MIPNNRILLLMVQFRMRDLLSTCHPEQFFLAPVEVAAKKKNMKRLQKVLQGDEVVYYESLTKKSLKIQNSRL